MEEERCDAAKRESLKLQYDRVQERILQARLRLKMKRAAAANAMEANATLTERPESEQAAQEEHKDSSTQAAQQAEISRLARNIETR